MTPGTTDDIKRILEEKKKQDIEKEEPSAKSEDIESKKAVEQNDKKDIAVIKSPENSGVKEKEGDSSKVYVSFSLLVIAIAVISYFIGTLNTKIVEKEVTVEKNVTIASFDKLPENEKAKYILKEKHDLDIKNLNDELSFKDKEDLYTKETIDERSLKIKSDKFNIFKCYDEEVAGYNLSSSCSSKIGKFLKENKNAYGFEIIGVVDPKDRELFNSKIKDKTLTQYALMGLSRKRVVEASWRIKETLGHSTVLMPVNFNINSKVSRGFVIRAYK